MGIRIFVLKLLIKTSYSEQDSEYGIVFLQLYCWRACCSLLYYSRIEVSVNFMFSVEWYCLLVIFYFFLLASNNYCRQKLVQLTKTLHCLELYLLCTNNLLTFDLYKLGVNGLFESDQIWKVENQHVIVFHALYWLNIV